MPSYANAAEQSVAINYIHEEGQAKGSKLAYKLYPDTLKPISDDLELPLEASINFWEYGENNQHDVNHLLAISPILRDPLTGAMAGLLSGGRERKQTVAITYLHYSNAGLSKPTLGLDFVDFVNLAYSYRF